MKRRSGVLFFVFALCVCLPAVSHAISSTFDTGLDGWVNNPDGSTIQWVSTGGNPGGYVRVDDTAAGVGIFLFAPSKFLGDLSAFDGGTLSFDQNLLVAPNVENDQFYGFVHLVSGVNSSLDGFVDLIPVSPPPPGWNSWSIPMTATAWGKTQSEWDQLLADVDVIRVFMEAGANADASGFDNFSIVPEPSTALLFAFSLIGLGVKTRLRSAVQQRIKEDRTS